jgi:hypothetical protein
VALLKLRRFFQFSLTAEPRKQFHLTAGDYLEPEVVEEGILLKPIRVVEQKKAWDGSDGGLRHDWRGVFVLCLSEKILSATGRVLLAFQERRMESEVGDALEPRLSDEASSR